MRRPVDSMAGVGAAFSTLWSIAILFHLLGAGDVWTLGDNADRWWGAALGLAAVWVLIRPNRPIRFLVLATVQLVDVAVDAPLLGSHWILAGLISLTLIIGFGVQTAREGAVPDIDNLLHIVGRYVRFEVVAFYSFAALAKLNTGFFDPNTSCAVDFYTDLARSPSLTAPALLHAVIWGTVIVEIALPILLAIRRTRIVGVWVGLALHFLLALDPFQHVADFSSTMYALLLAFFAPQVLRAIADSGSWRLSPGTRAVLFSALIALLGAVAFVEGFNTAPILIIGRQLLWAVFAVSILLLFSKSRAAVHELDTSPTRSVLLVVPVVLLLLNGATPYLTVKDGSAFNMYSNLNVGAESSNHLLVRSGLVAGTHRADVAEIIDSNDPEIVSYRDRGLGLTLFELRDLASERPDMSVRFSLNGVTYDVLRAGDDPILSVPLTRLERKLLLFRPVSLDDPASCVRGWGPAM